MKNNRYAQLTFVVIIAIILSSFFDFAMASPNAYVGNFKDNTVSVIDIAKSEVVATIPVEAVPHGMILSTDGRWLYVSSDGSSIVNVIDTKTNKVSGLINVGKSPHGLALTTDGKYLLVCVNSDDKIVYVDTEKKTVVASVSVGKPHTISVSPNGEVAYVASQEVGEFKLAVIDLNTQKVIRNIILEKTPRDLEFSYDGKVLLFTLAGINAVQVLDPLSDKVVAAIQTGASPHYANIFKVAMVGMVVVQGPGELLFFDQVTYKPGIQVKVGIQPHWMTVSSDGKTAFVTNEGSNNLSIIDLKTGQVTNTIPVGNQPRKVVVQLATPASGDANVSIKDFAFIPALIKINPGQSVVWNNNDGSSHVVAFKDQSKGSETLFPGESYSRKFEKPGIYEYYCSIHNYMTGKVEVMGKGK